MVGRNTFLIETVAPAVRKVLVRERIRAMRGGFDEAIRRLDEMVSTVAEDSVHDVVSLAMLKAELLYLDRQYGTALAYFQQRVLPLKPRLETSEQFVVEQNLADLGFSTWSPTAGMTFYGSVDRRRIAGFEFFDAREILEAQQAAAAGKHFEALPIIWRQSVRAYLQGSWQSCRLAAKRMAEESLQLGSLVDAAFYGVSSSVEEFAKPLAEAVLRRRDVGVVRDLVRRVMEIANLRRYFSVACEIVYLLGDAIANEDLKDTAEWLLRRAEELPDSARAQSALNMAWKALEPIAHRLTPDLARRAVEVATTHPVWTTKLENPNALIIERKQMVETMNHLVAVVGTDDLGWIARESLPLALERRQVHDYHDVVNLLCHVAKRGGPLVKQHIGDALFPPGKPLDRILVQVLPIFRSENPAPERVISFADTVAHEIGLQVQYVASGQQPVQLPETVFTHFRNVGDRTMYITSVGGVGLHATARHREMLSAEALERLANAVLEMTNERENLVDNRVMLLRGLMEFADCVGTELRQRILSAIKPLAEGEIEEPLLSPQASEAADPLNPFKIHGGRPSELQSMALVALTEFARFDHDTVLMALPLLERTIYDQNPEVRRGAFVAVARLPEISEPILLAVLMGTRETDPSVATAAFFAIARQPTWTMSRKHWRIFVHSLRLGAQSQSEKVRRSAAVASCRWESRVPTKAIRMAFMEAKEIFLADICSSVRDAVSQPAVNL
jgi:hypothetical protein